MINSVTCNPHNPWLAHSARIANITPETPGVATYDLIFDGEGSNTSFPFQPGQFSMLYLPGLGEIAISISGDPANTGLVSYTIREAGNVTQALAAMPKGSSLGIRGPFGTHWPLELCESKDVILVAGGIGLAPLRPVIYSILANRDRFGSVTVLYGARTPSGLLYTAEFDQWRASGVSVKTTVDRSEGNWEGNVGVVTPLLDRLPLASPENTILMTCGPEVMMWYTIQTALSRGVRQDAIYVSLERNMNCAIGLCGHCQFGPQFICKDGPVFRFDNIASLLRVTDL